MRCAWRFDRTSGAFERLVDLERGWWLDLIESVGGPWQLLDAGRARLEEVAAGRARDGELDAVWGSLSRATRPTAEQVRAGGASLRMLARRIRAPGADAAELSALAADEVGDDEAYRCLLTVPGVGPATAAQLVAGVCVWSTFIFRNGSGSLPVSVIATFPFR